MSDLNGTVITWLGHSTVLLETSKGTRILIDPFIEGNPRYPEKFLLPAKLDLILATHGHADHIGDLVALAKKSGGQVVAMFELAEWVQSKGVANVIPMNLGGSYTFADATISMTEAHHSSGIKDGDQVIYGGEPAGFIISLEGGPVLYHAGDTSVFAGMQIIRELWGPTLGMLPIGGFYTMDPKGAALAARMLGLSTILPLHWGTFPPLTGTPDQLQEHLADPGVTVLRVQPGEPIR